MTGIRTKIEEWMERFGHTVYRHHWIFIIIMILVVAGPASQLPKIKMDTSTESFLHHSDPNLETYNEFKRQFGKDDFVIVAVEPDDVFSFKTLERIKSLHEDLEQNVPYIDDIISMVNARNTRGEGDRLIVEDLLENWPQTDEELAELKKRVLSNPLYVNRLISEDAKFTTIVLLPNSFSSLGVEKKDPLDGFSDVSADAGALEGFEESGNPGDTSTAAEPDFLTDAENTAIVETVDKIIAEHRSDDFKIYLTGSPVITHFIKQSMLGDMKRFVKLVVLTIGLVLFLLFRRITGVVLPLLVVAFALVSTVGLMSALGVPIKLPTTILPSFLLAVGVGAVVHILSMFYHRLQESGDREEAISWALGHSGLAVIMTSLTTAAGLASFSTSRVAPISELGIFAGLGVMLALVYTLILLPALLSLIPLKVKKTGKSDPKPLIMDKILRRIADFSTGNAKIITIVTIVLIIFFTFTASRLVFSHHILRWLPEKLPARVATEKINDRLQGTVAMEVVVDTGHENGLYDVEILNALENLARGIEKIDYGELFVGKATSPVDILKEIHQALNENNPEFYAVPQNRDLIPQEFLLFENSGSDDLEDLVDARFQLARFTIKVPWIDAIKYNRLIEEVESRFNTALDGKATATMTGLTSLLGRIVYVSMHSMAESYIIAGVVITIMMLFLIGRIKLGLISMIPNLLPIITTLGLMGIFHAPLDMFTMLIGSIAIGLAVDDTVHFMHNYIRYLNETGDSRYAVRETLHTTGRAMLVTSIVLSLGFFIYTFASMKNLYYFGLLTGLTIILALLADFLVAPALVTLMNPPTKEK